MQAGDSSLVTSVCGFVREVLPASPGSCADRWASAKPQQVSVPKTLTSVRPPNSCRDCQGQDPSVSCSAGGVRSRCCNPPLWVVSRDHPKL